MNIGSNGCPDNAPQPDASLRSAYFPTSDCTYQADKISVSPREATSGRIVPWQNFRAYRISNCKAQAGPGKIKTTRNSDGKRSSHPRTNFQERNLPLFLVNQKLSISDTVVLQRLNQPLRVPSQNITKRYGNGLNRKSATVENVRSQDSRFHRTDETPFVCSKVHIVTKPGRNGLHD